MPPLRLPKILRKEKSTTSSFGKKREVKDSVKQRAEGTKTDVWPNQGEIRGVNLGKKNVYIQNSYKRIYSTILKKDPITHLIKKGNRKPDLLVLGPGAGHDIVLLKLELQKNKINPRIDVLGIQKTIDLLLEKVVDKDLSSGKALEEISQEPGKNKKIISKLKERYDMVVAASSAGLHTLYPAFNVFNISAMLKKGGVAYIEVPTKERINDKEKGHFGIPEKHRTRIINQLERLPEIVSRFLESYGGKKYAQEFSFSTIDHLDSLSSPDGLQKNLEKRYVRYIKVERK